MQPGQQPPQGFQWDSAGQQQTSPAPQMLQGAPNMLQGSPNMLQGAPQTMMGNNAYGQNQIMMQPPSTYATASLVVAILALVGGFLTSGFGCLLAPISLLLANSALKVTTMHPGHSDHGTARAAQIISGILCGLLFAGLSIFLFIVITFNGL